MTRNPLELKPIADQIIDCALKVNGVLGFGFSKEVYERALLYELEQARLRTEPKYPMNVYYEGIIVGEFFADFVVQNCILVEIEAVLSLEESHKTKCLNYLKASELDLCLLINFGTSQLQVETLVLNLPPQQERFNSSRR